MTDQSYSSPEPSSPWSRDSIHRFDNLADRARPGKGKFIPKPPREEKRDSHLGPGLHQISTDYELKHSCPSFAGSIPKTAAASLGATTRKLSSPKTEFANTPACYDVPSMFVPKGQGILVNHPNCSGNGSACFLSTGRNDVTLGFENSARQQSNGNKKNHSNSSSISLGCDEGARGGEGVKGGISRSKIFIKTEGRPLRPDGSGDLTCLGPGRHHSPATFLRGQLTATRKNWPYDINKSISLSSSASNQQINTHHHNYDDDIRSFESYSIDRSSNSTMTSVSVMKEIMKNNNNNDVGLRNPLSKHQQQGLLPSSSSSKHHVRPNQAQAQAAVELAVKLAAMAASERRPNTAPAQFRSSSHLSYNQSNNKHTSPSTPILYSPLNKTTNISKEQINNPSLPHSSLSSSQICSSPLSTNLKPSSMNLLKSNQSSSQKLKLRKIKSSKKCLNKKETAQSLLEAEITTVRLLPLEGLLGPAYQ